MTQVLFRKASKTSTTGIWFAHVNKDLQDFCSKAYGVGLKIWTRDFRDFRMFNCAINLPGYSLRVWFEV